MVIYAHFILKLKHTINMVGINAEILLDLNTNADGFIKRADAEFAVSRAEDDMKQMAIMTFKEWFKSQSGTEPMEHTVNKFIELMKQ